jgi:hypothetical protein
MAGGCDSLPMALSRWNRRSFKPDSCGSATLFSAFCRFAGPQPTRDRCCQVSCRNGAAGLVPLQTPRLKLYSRHGRLPADPAPSTLPSPAGVALLPESHRSPAPTLQTLRPSLQLYESSRTPARNTAAGLSPASAAVPQPPADPLHIHRFVSFSGIGWQFSSTWLQTAIHPSHAHENT